MLGRTTGSSRSGTAVPGPTYRADVEFAVLGPLRVMGAAGPVDIAGAKERTLVARLVADAGRMVPVEDLIDSLWDESPPRSAAKSLQTFVLRVRNMLEPRRDGQPSLLVTDGPGYRLAVLPEAVDAERFLAEVTAGRQALRDGNPVAARRHLRGRPRSLARPGVRRLRGHAVRPPRGQPPGGAAARRAGGPCRDRPRGGSGGRRRRRPRAAAHRAPLPGAAVGAADDRAVPHRQAGRRAQRVRPGP